MSAVFAFWPPARACLANWGMQSMRTARKSLRSACQLCNSMFSWMPYPIPPVSCQGFIRPIIFNERWFLSQLKIRLPTAEGTWLYSNCSWDLMHSQRMSLTWRLLFLQGLTEGICLSSGTASLFHRSNPSKATHTLHLVRFKSKSVQK